MITYNLDLKKSKVYLKSPNITEINKTLFKNKFTSIKVGKKLNFFLVTKRYVSIFTIKLQIKRTKNKFRKIVL